jgi:serine phosphatase RsbU (regulator of sigma subunit)
MRQASNILILIALSAATGAIGYINTQVGVVPDLTILYLLPLAVAGMFLGLGYGWFLVTVATAVNFISNRLLEIPFVGLGTLSRFLTFLLVVTVINRLSFALEKARRLEEIRNSDLETARQIHRAVFVPAPASHGNLAIGSRRIFARELGGDYYYFAPSGDKLFFAIGDIAGKSIAAALFSSLLHQNVISALDRSEDPAAVTRLVNKWMTPVLPDAMFITFFCGLIDDKSLSFVNAGHEPPLLYSQKSGGIQLLASDETLPLGIGPELELKTTEIAFGPGDILLAVTDGVTESPNFRGDPFLKLELFLRDNRASEPQEIADMIMRQSLDSVPEGQSPDDVTIVCIRNEGG